jgi:glycosyltransferase involved in cell wall biosynthesis
VTDRVAERARVLVLAKGLGRGGAEQIIASTVPVTDPSRFQHEVAYVLPHKDALVPRLRSAGVPVHCLGGGRVAWVRALVRLLRAQPYDLVHTHMPVVAAVARVAAPRRARFVHTEHNLWQRYHPLTRWVNAITYRRNAAVLAVSSAVAESISRRWLGGRDLRVLQHGVDHESLRTGPAARAQARHRLNLGADTPVVGTVANLTPKKDQSTLLAAFAAVRRSVPAARLVVVGAGPLAEQLRETARALAVDDAVHWLGSRDDVPELLPAFDVFCLSSLHEGLPISLLEALGSGVACVCTDVGGISEVLADGISGRTVPPADPGALAAALVAVLTDPVERQRLAAAGRRRSQDFDISAAASEVARTYATALGRDR